MIRRILVHTFEGGKLHDLSVYLAERSLSHREGPDKVKLWSPSARHDFMGYSDYPGLPDLVYTKIKTRETFVIEFESSPSKKILDKKRYQFFRNGITDVIVVDLSKFKATSNWRKLEEQVEEWLL